MRSQSEMNAMIPWAPGAYSLGFINTVLDMISPGKPIRGPLGLIPQTTAKIAPLDLATQTKKFGGSDILHRRSYVVIVGEEAPEGEIANAQEIAKFLRRTLNVSVGAYMPVKPSTVGLKALSSLINVIIVGGPHSNEYAFLLNDYLNPKIDMTVTREQNPDETYTEYIASGAVIVRGYLLDETPYTGGAKTGMIGMGKKRLFDRIMAIEGWDFEDTCAIGKAFRDGQGPGIYSTNYTKMPDMTKCPEDAEYSLTAAPSE